MSEWDLHQQQQHAPQQQQQPQYQPQRSQSMSVHASQLSSHVPYPVTNYGQHNYDRRQHGNYPIPPLQVNPSSFSPPEMPSNLPPSSLAGAQPMARGDRNRAQSVALTSIGQREQPGYASSSNYRMAQRSAGPNYPSEATVPISRHHASSRTWTQYSNEPNPPLAEPQVPYISSVMSPYPQPMGMPSRVMPPLSELDRRTIPPIEEAQPRPKPHVCEQCGAAFSRAHDLKRHIETHKGDRPHKCPTCTKAFSRKDALQRHQSMAQCGVDPQEMYQ